MTEAPTGKPIVPSRWPAVTAATVSGDVRLKLESARLEAHTVSGDFGEHRPGGADGDLTERVDQRARPRRAGAAPAALRRAAATGSRC